MFDVMSDMSKERLAWFQRFHVFQRSLEPQVRLMRSYAQTVEYQEFEVTQALERGRRNFAEIGCVSKVIKTIRDHRQPSVDHLQGGHLEIATEAKRRAVKHRVRNY